MEWLEERKTSAQRVNRQVSNGATTANLLTSQLQAIDSIDEA